MISVIGGANADIIGVSHNRPVPSDSNPGTISVSPGGVGRNIAQAVKELIPDGDVELITVLGDDTNSRYVKEMTLRAGVGLDHSLIVPGGSCPTYMAIMDKEDMLLAVNDMALLDKLTPAVVDRAASVLERSEAVVLDANLPEETIIRAVRDYPHVKFCAEPVSSAKCSRFNEVLDGLYLLKPNRLEAGVLTGMSIHSSSDALRAAEELLDRGVENVLITLGAAGSVFASREGSGEMLRRNSGADRRERNVNGAGDYYLSAALLTLLQGGSAEEAARRGAMAAEEKVFGGKR